MKLIICEKPSLAKNVASAIGVVKFVKNSGYIECKNNYVVSYAFGHLLNLVEPKDLPENIGKKWNEYTLPIFPEKFVEEIGKSQDRKTVDSGKKKQLEILKKLSKTAECIINCGDADREGQIIIDNIIEYIGYKGKVKRLWLPEQTSETIIKQLECLKDNEEYKNLRNEGYARRYLDWLYGMNITIFLTRKSSIMLNAGRVLIPIVKFVYDRDLYINKFVPEPYFTVESKENDVHLKYKDNFKEKVGADELASNLNKNKAVVTDITSKNIIKRPKKLFSLSTLQSELSKKYKMAFAKSLPIIQKLYEQGYITYPRTNTEYLSNNEYDKVSYIIEVLLNNGYENLENRNKKTIYDDSKIESHSAITITKNLADFSKFNEEEKQVYKTILNRFLANFTTEETIVSERTMLILVGDVEFNLKGTTIVSDGFYKYEPKEFNDKLPNLNVGDNFDVNFVSIDKMTTPPTHITESELSKLLKNPLKKEEKEENDDEDYKAILSGIEIGTEATRTGIIENAVRYGYISKEKQSFKITEKGINYINILDKLEINLYKEKSVEISQLLKKVYLGEISIQDILNITKEELDRIIRTDVNVKIDNLQNDLNILCKCPECTGDIYINKSVYSCNNKDCNFVIFKNNKLFESYKVKVTDSLVKSICEKKETKSLKLKSKVGNEYNAKFVYIGMNEKNYPSFKLEFVNKK